MDFASDLLQDSLDSRDPQGSRFALSDHKFVLVLVVESELDCGVYRYYSIVGEFAQR